MTPIPSAARLRAVVVLAALALVAPATAAAAAGEPAQPAGDAQPAWVRATHLVPDLPQMDVDLVSLTAGGTTTVDGAGYGDVSEYVKVPAGGFTVDVRPGDSAPGTAPVLSTTLRAEPGRAYTIAALGTAAQARLVPVEDDLTPPAAGQARVRVLSAASTAGAVDITAVGGPAVARSAAFGTSSTYADVPAGRWTLRAAPSAGAPATAAAGSSDVELAAGSTYTLAVLDGPAAGSAGAAPQLVVEAVADAAGSAAVPVGGAATGAGGTADGPSGVAGSAWTGLEAPAVRDGLLGAGAAAGAGLLLLLALRGRADRGGSVGARAGRSTAR